jgi:hypothetical protein
MIKHDDIPESWRKFYQAKGVLDFATDLHENGSESVGDSFLRHQAAKVKRLREEADKVTLRIASVSKH